MTSPSLPIRLVLSSCPPDHAQAIADALVEEQLAACVNIMPAGISTYRWQGEIARDREVLLLIKTASTRVSALAERIRELHPYELPEVIAVPVLDGLTAYIDWVVAESQPPSE
ncbi:MAG: divalent-cation tolerance protein CutA [Pseudomonadota bacterium]